MVNLTRIYTGVGDKGQTHLVNMEFTSKTDPRVAAYGDVDEANSIIGIVRSLLPKNTNSSSTGTTSETAKVNFELVDEVLKHCQNELFDVGADLANPYDASPKWAPLRIESASITRLEGWCDSFSANLPNLRSFILPGGSSLSSYLNLARTVIRRSERHAWAVAQQYGLAPQSGGVNQLAIQYLNRMSDLLFVLGRYCNLGVAEEVLWVPGTDRNPPDSQAAKQRDRIDKQQEQLDNS